MGESKQRKRRHAQILAECPLCIYCGDPANTAEHMPPITLFHGRWRPNQMVFPCCHECNNGTRLADKVASLLSRMYPDAPNPDHRDEVRKLLDGVANNIPGLISEMWMPPGEERFLQQRLQMRQHFLRTNGPLISGHLRTFAAKMGFALHYELTKKVISANGGVKARWYSNVRARGEFPLEVLHWLNGPRTLTQGTKHASEQFRYKWYAAQDGSWSATLSFFRQSFAVFAMAANHLGDLPSGGHEPVLPGGFKSSRD